MTQRVRGSFPQFHQLRDEVDRLFSNFVAHPTVAGATRLVTGREFPLVNLWEDMDNVYAECELPGVHTEDLDVSVIGNELTLKGRRGETCEPQAVFHRRERGLARSRGQFHCRRTSMPIACRPTCETACCWSRCRNPRVPSRERCLCTRRSEPVLR